MENNQFEEELFEIKNAKGTIKKLIKSMLKQKIRLFIVIISVILYTIFNIIAPLYSAKVIDIIWNNIKESLTLGKTFKITWEIGGLQIFTLLLIYIGSGLFYTLQNFVMASFAEKLNLEYYDKYSDYRRFYFNYVFFQRFLDYYISCIYGNFSFAYKNSF